MANKVFISHKNADSELAKKVANRVEANGLNTYLDVIDDAILKDGPDLADILLGRMSACDQLIAVVSTTTKMSWWVPWEIGVGSEKGFRMASYSESHVSLPSYLEKWPDLHSSADIDLYCAYSKVTEKKIERRTAGILTEQRRLDVLKTEAQEFHKGLLSRLRERR